MSNNEKGLELKVGLFICIGLAVIAVMIVWFGLGGRGFQKYYNLQVDLPNANGLLKGSDVMLAGARIGYVATTPVLSGNLGAVHVTVKIDQRISIPKETKFQVNSSGLLGDKFVEVLTLPEFDPKSFDPEHHPDQVYQPGESIQGVRAEGIDTLMEEAGPALKKLSAEIVELQAATTKLSDGFLNDTNQKNVEQTLASLKITSENFSNASKGVGKIVQNAQEAVDSAKKTMAKADGAADDLRKVLAAAREVLQKATTGDGAIATLLTNRDFSENLKALVINLRQHGVLFYKNSSKPEAQPSPTPSRKGRRP